MKKAVLVVDDPVGTLEALGDALDHAGYDVTRILAPTPEEAVAPFVDAPPEIVLVQLFQGGGSGVTLTEQVRQRADGAIVPILFFGTGMEMVTSVSDALAVGGDYYFQHPLDITKVVAKIRAYIGVSEDTAMADERTRPNIPMPGFVSVAKGDDKLEELDFFTDSTEPGGSNNDLAALRQADEDAKKRFVEEAMSAEAESESRLGPSHSVAADLDEEAQTETIDNAEAEMQRLQADLEAQATGERARAEQDRKQREAEEAALREQLERAEAERLRAEEEAHDAELERQAAEAELQAKEAQQRAAEARIRREEDARLAEQLEITRLQKQALEEEARRLAEERAQLERLHEDAAKRRKQDEEELVAREVEIRRRAEEQARVRADEERIRTEEKARADELRKRIAEETRRRVEIELKIAHDAEERKRLDEEAKRKEAELKRLTEEALERERRAESDRRAAEAERRRVEEDARLRAEEAATREAELRKAAVSEDDIRKRIEKEVRARLEGEVRSSLSKSDDPAAPPAAIKAPPKTSGVLETEDISEVLAGFVLDRITGRVRFSRNTFEKIVTFDAGKPVELVSNDPQDRLEDFLFRERYLTRAQYQACRLKQLANPRQMGAAVIAEGYLKAQELFDVVRQHFEFSLQALLEWDGGVYLFEETLGNIEDRIVLPQNPERLLTAGIKRRYTMPRLVLRLGGPSSLLVGLQNPDTTIDKLGFEPKEKALMKLIDGAHSIEDMVFSTGLSEERVYQVLAALVAFRLAEVAVRGVEGADAGDEARGGAIDRARIKEAFELAKKADYFEFLGLSPGATEFEIERGLQSVKRAFAIERFTIDISQELAEELKEVDRVLADAEYVLSDSRLRDAYVQHMQRGRVGE